MGENEGQTVQFIQRFFIKLIPDPIFLGKAKCENDEIVQIDS